MKKIIQCCINIGKYRLDLSGKNKHYVHSHGEILSAYWHCLVEHENPSVIRLSMGTEKYIFRSRNKWEIFDIADYVLQKPC